MEHIIITIGVAPERAAALQLALRSFFENIDDDTFGEDGPFEFDWEISRG